MTLNYDREEFRKYLQDSGAVEAVSRVFLKLYELKGNRPKSSIKFIQDRISDAAPSLTEFENLKDDLIAMDGILSELRTAGKLEKHHIAVIDTIGRKVDATKISGANTNVDRPITARQSQIVLGNEIKKSATMGSKIRQFNKTDPGYEQKILDAIDALSKDTKSNSLLKKCLTVQMYTTYKAQNTTNGTTFVDCICTGLDIPESMIGVYAPDIESYDTFGDLFNPIIKEYHGFDRNDPNLQHPPLNWDNPSKLPKIDPTEQYIVSTRIRCIRNVEGNPLVPKMDDKNLKKLCGELKVAFTNNLTVDDLKGDWYELNDISDDKLKRDLIDNGYILEYGDKFLESAGATKYWPTGRAVYINKKKTFFAWINEEDHIRFISMEANNKIGDIYKLLKDGVETVQKAGKLTFRTHQTLGFVSLCPTNLGNTIRASVTIKVPKLLKQNQLEGLAKKHNLEIRPGSAASSDTVEISNKKKLGITEFQTVENLCKGITEIIDAEAKL